MLTLQWNSKSYLQASDSVSIIDFDHPNDQSSIAIRIDDTNLENYRNRDKAIFLPGEYEMQGAFFRVYPCGKGSSTGANICNFVADGISTCVVGQCADEKSLEKVIECCSGAGVLVIKLEDSSDQKVLSTLVHQVEPSVVVLIDRLKENSESLTKLVSDLGVEHEDMAKLKIKQSDISHDEDSSLRVVVMK